MTHTRIHHSAITLLVIGSALAPALTTTTAPASARTFDFNSAGSMFQQPPPARCGCVSLRASTNQAYRYHLPNLYFHTRAGA
jgi:hypothetical protein